MKTFLILIFALTITLIFCGKQVNKEIQTITTTITNQTTTSSQIKEIQTSFTFQDITKFDMYDTLYVYPDVRIQKVTEGYLYYRKGNYTFVIDRKHKQDKDLLRQYNSERYIHQLKKQRGHQ